MSDRSDIDIKKQATNCGDAEQICHAVANLAHELAEAVTAINHYLHSCQLLEKLDGPGDLARLHEAVGKAIEQASRAGKIAGRLRSIVNRQNE